MYSLIFQMFPRLFYFLCFLINADQLLLQSWEYFAIHYCAKIPSTVLYPLMSRKKAPEGSDNNCSTLTQDTILFSPSPLKAKTQQETQKAVMLSPFPIKLSKPLDIIVPRLSCSPRPTPRSVSSTHQGSPLLPLGPYSAPTNILVNENFTLAFV